MASSNLASEFGGRKSVPANTDLVSFEHPEGLQHVATLTGSTASVLSLALFRDADDSPCLASAGNAVLIELWNLTTHQHIATLTGHRRSVPCLVSFSNDH